jgi:tagatose 1,6-diphosphate aldolase GatY/KbaY
MLARFSELLAAATASRGAAVGAFTCYNLEQAAGVLRAAEVRGAGVVILVTEKSFAGHDGPLLMSALVAAAERSRAFACVQLDHVSDLALIESAFSLGAGAVLADGSHLPFEENVALVAAAAAGGEVEAELAGIAGDEDVATAQSAGAYTDPELARRLVERTRAACLAVSIGNVHGVYREPPQLDWDRLAALRASVDCPLALHGASGLSDADVRRAIELGIAKVNVYTELRERYLAVTAERIDAARDGLRLLDLNAAQTDAIADVAGAKLDLCLGEPGGQP